ncbi:complex I subunit 5 family protein [Bdellovibrio bacteriovorus]|uniref:NADH dehydrogenase n=1 Tax=Bdellovibrio bacteriovorus str. Tiberius TaxID=1069642 RepID=K7YZ01_BDEBC|nr:proton-conducting transporter membrane subunit [Bdellovibrio bacteriovorus]AFY01920.1 NADH dehydrogenase [Bdellovibrio bacteriovorus str. Tiberius]
MIVAPVLISFVTAILTYLCRKNSILLRCVSLAGSVAALAASVHLFLRVEEGGIQTMQIGNWQAPFGISFSVGLLAGVMLVGSSLVALCGNMSMQALLNRQWELRGYYSLFHFMMMGVFGAFSTGDLFNLYVWYEVMLASSFFLVAMSRYRTSVTGAYKYAVLSILSSVAFLIGIAFIYNTAGSLDIVDLIQYQRTYGQNLGVVVGLCCLVMAFSVKSALFPFFFWMPAAYPVTLTAVAGVFAGFLTKVGVYSLLRILVPVAALPGSERLLPLLYVLALISMILGVLGALSRDNMKGILAFHSTSQVGYMVLGLSLGTSAGIAACVFYMIHHMLVKTNLFFSVAAMEKVTGTSFVSESGGLWKARPVLGAVFAFSALSLIGVPPLSGFWAKVLTLQAALVEERWLAVAMALAVSLLTLMSMLKIWNGVFWKPAVSSLPENDRQGRVRWLVVPLLTMTLLILAVGLGFQFLMSLTERMAQELMEGGLR